MSLKLAIPAMSEALSPSSVFNPLVEQAIELSAQWHDQTYRKSRWRDPAFDVPPSEVLGVPVVAHVTTVAMTVQRAGWDDVTIAAAFLHDVVEDANQYGEELRYGELCTLMGKDVADRVMEVTEHKYDAHGNFQKWCVRKEGYIAVLQTASAGAVAISLADKLHNLWSMNESMARGINMFQDGVNRRRLSAGPDQQQWFFHAVLKASTHQDDPRLDDLRARLAEEIARFEQLNGLFGEMEEGNPAKAGLRG